MTRCSRVSTGCPSVPGSRRPRGSSAPGRWIKGRNSIAGLRPQPPRAVGERVLSARSRLHRYTSVPQPAAGGGRLGNRGWGDGRLPSLTRLIHRPDKLDRGRRGRVRNSNEGRRTERLRSPHETTPWTHRLCLPALGHGPRPAGPIAACSSRRGTTWVCQ
jgi:hypothetical protein